jgi:chromosome transmission fidelity protein 4
MSEKRITAFPDGNSYVAFDNVRHRLVVGNSGGLLKVFRPLEPDLEPISIDTLENVTSLCTGDNTVLITTTGGNLEVVDLDKSESTGDLYRSELPLRDACYINEGKRVVTGGDDLSLVVIDLQTKPYLIINMNLPNLVVNVTYNATSEMLAVSLASGDVQIYLVINEKLALLDTIKGCLPAKVNTSMDEVDFASEHKLQWVATKTQWTANGELLLIPTKTNIAVYERSNWKQAAYCIGEFETVVDIAVSPSGKHVGVVDQSRSISIHSLRQRDDVLLSLNLTSTSATRLPLNLAWGQPKSASARLDLFVGTTNGEVVCVADAVLKQSEEVENLFLDQADEDSLAEEEDVDLDDRPSRPHHLEDSMIIDEDDEVEDHHPRKRRLHASNGDHKSRLATPVHHNSPTPLKPYCPGATPWTADKLSVTSRRYLSMTPIGYAWCVRSNDTPGQQSITVSFFDRAINKDYHFTDYNVFDMCSINRRGILLGCSGESRQTNAGKIFYRHHDSLQDSWEHQIPLLPGEYITASTITSTYGPPNGDEIIVVGTNLGYIRFFNLYGVCIYLMKLTPVLSLISSGDIVFVVNEVSPVTHTYLVINVSEDYRFVQQDLVLPLTNVANVDAPLIKGIFFNENNDPCLVGGHDDTLMVLLNWRESNNGKWIPILNLRHSITEDGLNDSKRNWNAWPLGLYKDQVSLLILKSGNKYPRFPLPLPIEVPIKLPVRYLKAQEEEDQAEMFLRALTMGRMVHEAMANHDEDAEDEDNAERLETYGMMFDRSLLKMFAQSCQEEQLSRAFSVARLIKSDKALFAATKIAERMEFITLATKIAKLREALLDDD